MDLNRLKNTWQQMAPPKELGEDQIRSMLNKRTKNLIERIDRNVRIGFVVLLALMALFIFDDLLMTPASLIQMPEDTPELPSWLHALAVWSNILIFSTFFYFAFSYYRTKKRCNLECNLRDSIQQIIGTLTLYRRLFYLALATIILAISGAFASGLYFGATHSGNPELIQSPPFLEIFGITCIFAILFGGSLFFALRWAFRSLYGNYIQQLKNTLKELQEIDQ